jgi:outer membrane receptor protein involved in Fe transport
VSKIIFGGALQRSLGGSVKRRLMTTSAAALFGILSPSAAGIAQAQENGPETEQVVVSASRITISGFEAPTPTTVVGAEDLSKMAQVNLESALSQLPSLLGSQGMTTSTSGASGGNNALSSLALRGFGAIRTLTLLDGQRVVAGNVTGVTDLGLLPQMLIQRVDIVTGGASASWGSDAVAGVVNIVTDKHFSGVKLNVEGGITTYSDDPQLLVQAAAGTDFAGGRGHIEGSLEYDYEGGIPGLPSGNGISGPGGRQWFSPLYLANYPNPASVPAGMPQYNWVKNGQETQYGSLTALVVSGPLQGTTFNANGQAQPFQYGVGPTGQQCVPAKNAAGSLTNCISPFASGGDLSGTFAQNWMAFGVSRQTGYLRASYDLTPEISVWGTAMFGNVLTKTSLNNFFMASVPIQCGNAAGGANAFLPASVNAQCIANNITSFNVGTANDNDPYQRLLFTVRDLRRFVIGVDGSFDMMGSKWTWEAFADHGETDTHLKSQQINQNYFNAAVDSIVGPNGNIVCRSPVAQQEGCVPYNPFTLQPQSQAVWNWVFGGSHMTNVNGRLLGSSQLSRYKQDSFSISLNGEPFSTWAGPVALATGFEWRREYYHVYGDSCSISNCGDPLEAANTNWNSANFFNGLGSYNVAEGFVEFVVPLLNDVELGNVNLDLGGRATGYSTSGYVNTWKLGLTYDTPIPGLRLRAVMSRDIRAPNLSELFAAPRSQNQPVTNDFTGTQSNIQLVTNGNPALQPEKAQTTEVGIVYSPEWLPGFNQSIDYYRTYLTGEINSFTGQNISDLCFQGHAEFCSAITTNPPGGNVATLPYSAIQAYPFNFASTVTDGFDFETSYEFSLNDIGIPGDFMTRALITHISKFILFTGVPNTIPNDYAGNNAGNGGTLLTGAGITPHWKLYANENYTEGDWTFNVTERFVSAGKYDNNYVQCTSACPTSTPQHPTISYNTMPSAFYLDLGGTYNFGAGWQAYYKIDNLLNKDPPQYPTGAAEGYGVNSNLYDLYGRFYHLGFRLQL